MKDSSVHDHRQDTLGKVKKEFRIANVFKTLEEQDPKSCGVARMLYERTIDFGAHPNERSVLGNMSKTTGDGTIEFKLAYLSGDTPGFRLSMKTTAQVGLWAFEVFENIFRVRCTALGIDKKLPGLREGL